MDGDRVLALFKFGKREHIDEFIRDGHLYTNTLKYFREREMTDVKGPLFATGWKIVGHFNCRRSREAE